MPPKKIEVTLTSTKRIESKLDRILQEVTTPYERVIFSNANTEDVKYSIIADKLVVKVIKFYQKYIKENPDMWEEIIHTEKFDELRQTIYKDITKHHGIFYTYFRALMFRHIATLPLIIYSEGLLKTPDELKPWMSALGKLVNKPAEYETVYRTVKRIKRKNQT